MLSSHQIITSFGSYKILTVIQSLNNNNINKKVCQIYYNIELFDFLRLYKKLPHDKLKSKISSIVDYAFKGRDKTFFKLFNNGAAYWGKKTKEGLRFSKASLKNLKKLQII